MKKTAKPMASSDALVHVETTLESQRDARRLVGLVLGHRLAACAQVARVRSHYWWKGRIEEASEFLVVFKTTAGRRDELVARIEEEHPYEVPYIASTTMAKVPRAYAAWLGTETATSDGSSRRGR